MNLKNVRYARKVSQWGNFVVIMICVLSIQRITIVLEVVTVEEKKRRLLEDSLSAFRNGFPTVEGELMESTMPSSSVLVDEAPIMIASTSAEHVVSILSHHESEIEKHKSLKNADTTRKKLSADQSESLTEAVFPSSYGISRREQQSKSEEVETISKCEEEHVLERLDGEILESLRAVSTDLHFTPSFVNSIPSTSYKDGIDIDDGASSDYAPYYLILFQRILVKVYCDRINDVTRNNVHFWGKRIKIVQAFLNLSGAAKKLFVRMFLRQRKWLVVSQLNYKEIEQDVKCLCAEILQQNLIESSENASIELGDAIDLLNSRSIKKIAKIYKIDANLTKADISSRLMKAAKQKNVFGLSSVKRMLDNVLKEVQSCYRLREDVKLFFHGIFTLYSPFDMDSSLLIDDPNLSLPSQLIFVLLQLSLNKVKYPAPPSPPVINIYDSSSMLFNYVNAKEIESSMALLMSKGDWSGVENCSNRARNLFKEGFISHGVYCALLPIHLRRYTDLSTYLRCIVHGIEALEKMRNYEKAVELLKEFLFNKDYSFFKFGSRGVLWNRLVLNMNAHLKQNDLAFDYILSAIDDPCLADKDRLILQDRGEKLSQSWKGPIQLSPLEKVEIDGDVLSKNLGDSRNNHFLVSSGDSILECSVEVVALNYYIGQCGFKEGVHAEGTIWHTVFGLLCYDLIFDQNCEYVWLSCTQTCPSDINTTNFYTSRKEAFDKRIDEIEQSNKEVLLRSMKLVFEQHYGETNSEISWNCFSDFEQIERFICCCEPRLLCDLIKRLVTDYRGTRSGFPDLTVWNNDLGLLAVVEVKGPGDKLSAKQRLWLNFFMHHGITAVVCHVKARKDRRIV